MIDRLLEVAFICVAITGLIGVLGALFGAVLIFHHAGWF